MFFEFLQFFIACDQSLVTHYLQAEAKKMNSIIHFFIQFALITFYTFCIINVTYLLELGFKLLKYVIQAANGLCISCRSCIVSGNNI